MYSIIIEFVGKMGRKVIFGLNRVQANNVEKNWIKNPDVKYVAIVEEF